MTWISKAGLIQSSWSTGHVVGFGGFWLVLGFDLATGELLADLEGAFLRIEGDFGLERPRDGRGGLIRSSELS